MADQTETLKKLFLKLKQTEAELDNYKKKEHEPIAVIGMACRFPGGADSPDKFWELISNGKDAITDVPSSRWDKDRFYRKNRDFNGKMYVKKGGFLSEDLSLFDNHFFSVTKEEAEAMDPQQRFLLEVSYEAFQDAGIPLKQLDGSKTGVFLGISNADYAQLNWRKGSFIDANAYSLTGTALSTAAGRISYMYGLEGPNYAVDTACSSSLVALHNACVSLRSGESDRALAGGVNMILSPDVHIVFCKMNALSEDGHCKPFDQSANGFIRSEGCGLVVLKRLSDAEKDGDNIIGLIRGSAVNQDGRSNGMTAPSGTAQQKVVKEALRNAGVQAADISYIEAHGTGTPIGDPIEVEALTNVMQKKEEPCWLGSVKANIGHAEAAAGIAGFIKTMLMFREQTIPVQIHFNQPSEFIDWNANKFVVPTETQPWKAEKRLAGLSSFGFGGTNAHVIMEEYIAPPAENSTDDQRNYELVFLSAKTTNALNDLAKRYSNHSWKEGTSLRGLAFSSLFHTTKFAKSIGFVVESMTDLKNELDAFIAGEEHNGVQSAKTIVTHKTAFVFSGQGGQWEGMGRNLYQTSACFRETIDACEKAFSAYVNWSLTEIMLKPWDEKQLIGIIQPLLFAIQVATAKWWISMGIQPTAVIGQSMGEVAAHYIAGGISLQDAARIICKRSILLERKEGEGAMAIIQLPAEEVLKRIEDKKDSISIAVDSSPTSTVVSGVPETVQLLLDEVESENIFARHIKANVASHSPLMDDLKADLLKELNGIQPQTAHCTIYSSVTGKIISGKNLDAAYWADNLREPVRLRTTLEQMTTDGYTTFIEISPHPVLEQNLLECFESFRVDAVLIPSTYRNEDEGKALMKGMAKLSCANYPVDWTNYYPIRESLVKTPAYPWQHKSFWSTANLSSTENGNTATGSESTYKPDWVEETLTINESLTLNNWQVIVDAAEKTSPSVQRFIQEYTSESTVAEQIDLSSFANTSSATPILRIYQLSDQERIPEAQNRVLNDLFTLSKELLSQPVQLHVVIAGNENYIPVYTSALAFFRSLSLEYPALQGSFCFLADESVENWPLLVADLVTGTEVVRYSEGKRFVQKLEKISLYGESPELNSAQPWLITGGLGSLGQYFSEWLVQHGVKHLVLTSRKSSPERAEWISELEKQGIRIDIVPLEMTDAEKVKELFGNYTKQGEAICGIIHAAGSISSVALHEMTTDELNRIHTPKIHGTWALHEATLEYPVDFMLLCSSVSAAWGSSNLVHYASANAFLDGMSIYRNAQGLPTLSVNWGSWENSTMAAGEKGEQLAEIGIRPSSDKWMLAELNKAFDSGYSQLVIAQMDWDVFLPLLELSGEKTLFDPLRNVDSATAETEGKSNAILESMQNGGELALEMNVQSYLKSVVAEFLSYENPNDLDVNQGFFKMGFDSLSAVSLLKRLKRELNLNLRSTLAFDFPTINQLADYLTEELKSKLFEEKGQNEELPTEQPAHAMEDLSFEEIKKMMEIQLGDSFDL